MTQIETSDFNVGLAWTDPKTEDSGFMELVYIGSSTSDDAHGLVLGGRGKSQETLPTGGLAGRLYVRTATHQRAVSLASGSDSGTAIVYGIGNIERVRIQGREGLVILNDAVGEPSITLSAETGDITLHNADVAEYFDADETAKMPPGTVVVINDEELLEPCARQADSRVVGVVSGGGEFKPGLLLDSRNTGRRRVPVTLLGKATCNVDGGRHGVRPGALLIASGTVGCARADQEPSPGTVLGKSLGMVAPGCVAQIPILVSHH